MIMFQTQRCKLRFFEHFKQKLHLSRTIQCSLMNMESFIKRLGGLSIQNLRADGYEPEGAIAYLLAQLGHERTSRYLKIQ